MPEHALRPGWGGRALLLGAWIGFLAWGVYVGAGVVEFLRTGRVDTVATLLGAVAVAGAALLAAAALAQRIMNAIREEHRATVRRLPPSGASAQVSLRRGA
jgi:hypothetical protein